MAKAKYLKNRMVWFRTYVDKWLRGKIRKEKSVTRSVLHDIVTMAADSPYENPDGSRDIKVADNVGYSNQQFCNILNFSMEEWLFGTNRLEKMGTIAIDDNNIIKVIHWHKYQTPYQRVKKAQKEYRDKLRDAGYRTMGEAIAKTFAEQKPDARSIFDTLKFLNPSLHEDLKKNLNGKFPKGHGFDEAKKLFDDWRKQ